MSGVGSVAQQYSACLACARPQMHSQHGPLEKILCVQQFEIRRLEFCSLVFCQIGFRLTSF